MRTSRTRFVQNSFSRQFSLVHAKFKTTASYDFSKKKKLKHRRIIRQKWDAFKKSQRSTNWTCQHLLFSRQCHPRTPFVYPLGPSIFKCTKKIFAFVDCFSLLDNKLGYFAPSSRSQIRMQSKIASNSFVAALFWHTGWFAAKLLVNLIADIGLGRLFRSSFSSFILSLISFFTVILMQIGKLSNTLKITRADWLRWCFHISIETKLHVQYYKLLTWR